MQKTAFDLEKSVAKKHVVSRLFATALIVMFAGFVLLSCYNKPFISLMVVPGLSLGIVMGLSVIVGAWLLTLFYVRWANKHFKTYS